MTTSVHALDLDEVDALTLSGDDLMAAYQAAGKRHWLAKVPNGYAVTRYRQAAAVLRDRRFHSAIATIVSMAGVDGPISRRQQRSILALEGEEHTRLRRLATPAFTPKAADRLRPFMRQVVDDLVDRVAASGRCELVADICEPYPIPIICELLGAPKEDWRLFSRWATDIFRIFNGDLAGDQATIEAAMGELDEYVRAMIEDRRRRPADDLLSRMIAVEEEGDRLSTAELVMMTEAVLMAGTDTTRNQLACSVALLAERPEQWAQLADDPSAAPRAVEETMRYRGTVRGTARLASEDITLEGVEFPAGTLVIVSLATSNRDEDVWDDPGRVDIGRAPAADPHLTFGSGIHYCLGAALARAELQEALPVLARRMRDLRLDGPIEWKPDNVGIWGPAKLPLRFTPEAP